MTSDEDKQLTAKTRELDASLTALISDNADQVIGPITDEEILMLFMAAQQ